MSKYCLDCTKYYLIVLNIVRLYGELCANNFSTRSKNIMAMSKNIMAMSKNIMAMSKNIRTLLYNYVRGLF